MKNKNIKKNRNTILIASFFLVLICTLIIAGCSSQSKTIHPPLEQDNNTGTLSENTPQPSQGAGIVMRNGSKLTEEQKQQIIDERNKQMLEACQEKAENDSCTMQNPRGGLTGTCKTQNSSLMCVAEMQAPPLDNPGGRQGPPPVPQ